MLSALSILALVAAAAGAPARPVLLRLRGGAIEQPKTGKVWVTSTFTRDHVRFAAELPSYLGAYANPFTSIEPKTIEAIMLTINSINTCPYCTGLHGQLARMAGVDKPDPKLPAVSYATTFAKEGGRGAAVRAAFDKLVASEGAGRAKNMRALCWFLLWGKTTGNSINSVRSKLVSLQLWKLTPFEVIMFVFYGPLFLVIGILNAILTLAPTVPAWFSATTGVVLWFPQMLFVLPAGIISLVLRILAAPFGGLDL